jgi:penicillin-binding protein 1A
VSLERRPAWRRAGRLAARIGAVLVVCLPIFAVATAVSGAGLLLFGDLPGTRPELRPRISSQPSVVYDATGAPIGEFREFDLTVPMTPQDVPPVLKDAVVAAEDNNFWEHEGFDPEGLARAAIANYREDDIVQGGSTITQQLIRERYLSREQTVERKLNEIILATRFERDMVEELGSVEAAKEQILFEYLDTAYFGGGAYGAAAAAETYFRKQIWNLTLSEAAVIAAVIPAPSDYGPRDDVIVAEQRRRNVLKSMLDLGMITTAEFDEAFAQVLWYAPLGPPPGPATVFHPAPEASEGVHPYFQDYLRTYLTERYGAEELYRGGLQIHTTIDPGLQALAEDSVARALAGTEAPLEMSLVSVEPTTGFVKALVGGRDFEASQVNLALGGSTGMQPGSSFKAFTVARALEEGYSPDHVYDSPGVLYVPGCGGQCAIRGGPGGPITMRAATAASTNTFFAQLVMDVGPDEVAELALRTGVTSMTPDKEYNLGLTLGTFEVSPLDMAAGFSVFANRGVRADATPVIYAQRPDGTMLEDNRGPRGVPVLNQAVADHTTDLLRGPVDRGTGRRAAIGRPAAGKTGTAEENKAAWFVGYTPQLSTAVWMGYSDEPRPLRGIAGYGAVYGGDLPAITFARFMGPAHESLPVLEFPAPGPLPAPSSEVRRIPLERGFPSIPQDCGGPCYSLPVVTSPPPPPPPPPPETAPAPEPAPAPAPEGP